MMKEDNAGHMTEEDKESDIMEEDQTSKFCIGIMKGCFVFGVSFAIALDPGFHRYCLMIGPLSFEYSPWVGNGARLFSVENDWKDSKIRRAT